MPGDAPCAEREEHGQDNRKFFRKNAHRERDTGENGLGPVATKHAVGNRDDHAQREAGHGKALHDTARFVLKRRRLRPDGAQRSADSSDFAARPGRDNLRDAVTVYHQRAGIHGSLRVAGSAHAPRRKVGALVDRQRLPCDQRLVHPQLDRLAHQAVRRNPIALAQQHGIAANHVPTRDPLLGAVPDHQCARAGKIAQRFKRALGAVLLKYRNSDHRQHRCAEDERLAHVAQHQVNCGRADQQQEHRLRQHTHCNGDESGRASGRQFVGPLLRQPARGLPAGQPVRAPQQAV